MATTTSVASKRGGALGNLEALQRSAGNQVVSELIRRTGVGGGTTTNTPTKKSTARDYDNMQFRVTTPRGGTAPPATAPYRVQQVKRQIRPDGTTPFYEAIGEVTGYQSKLPVIKTYSKPKDLKGWVPRVTHVNGMGVMPQSGMTSAQALAGSVAQASGQHVDVLYTYSAQRSNIGADLWSCIKGKAGRKDDVTRAQVQTMLDAVVAKRRISLSAHSRGTIKTDNAVRTAFKTLVARYKPGLMKDPAVLAVAAKKQPALEFDGIPGPIAADIALDMAAESAAKKRVKAVMDKYIQLVYGGNAVSYPSSVLPVELFVGKGDLVSLGVGTYTDWGAKQFSGNKRTRLNKGKGGHGYTANYAGPVGAAIGADVGKYP